MNILLIDDHPIFRAGLELLLKEIEPGAAVLHAGSCAEGIELARREPLNLVFLDLHLPDRHGLECLRMLKAAQPGLPVVMVSGLDIDNDTLEQALELHAMGFVPKSENVAMISAALRAALAGGVFLPVSLLEKNRLASGYDWLRSAALPPGFYLGNEEISPEARSLETGFTGAVAERNINRPAPCRAEELGITNRQREVLRLLALGMPNKRIALQLGISQQVVKKHVSDLLAHFHTVSRTQLAVQLAARKIFFEPPAANNPLEEKE